MAASLGFEPRQRDPESPVLPLHHEAKAGKVNAKFAKFEISESRANRRMNANQLRIFYCLLFAAICAFRWKQHFFAFPRGVHFKVFSFFAD